MSDPATALLAQAMALQPQLTQWRRDIHMHPELGFQEERTAALAASELAALGCEVSSGVGGTGVVGKLGQGRPAVGLRADMDALPIQEANQVSYASQTPGVMHACGHDAHVAMLLGAASLLSRMTDRPSGEIRFLFQPSEERMDSAGKTGSLRMIEDGALDGLDFVAALHVKPALPTNTVEITPGYALASGDFFEATVIGRGCHDSTPHLGVDPIYLLAQVLNAVYAIRARRIDPLQVGTISIGAVHGGERGNIVPEEIRLKGTIRAFSDQTRGQLHAELERALSITRALGGDYALSVRPGVPATFNDPGVAQAFAETAASMLGPQAVRPPSPELGVEDFAQMARRVPGAIVMLGAQPHPEPYPHHNAHFDLDEACLPIGAALLAGVACRLLS